ncbi:MAG: DUF3987 domain-containing protein [Bacillota bacterium]
MSIENTQQDCREQQQASGDGYQPFPTHLLSAPAATFIRETAAAMGVDEAFIAVPMLPVVASAIGNSRRITLKPGWSEPSVIWAATVAESGSAKSPALAAATQPAWARQQVADESKHFVTSDTTIPALMDRLANNPRGLLVVNDELSGWLGRYRNGRWASDLAAYLSMFGAGPVKIDRKGGQEPSLFIPRAAVSITGGVQPKVLGRVLTQELLDSGLAARFLFAMPPRQAKMWTEQGVTPETSAAMLRLLDTLYGLSPAQDREPIDLPMTESATALWAAFFDAHAKEQAELGDSRLVAAWAKLEGYAARLALVVHCLRQAAGEAVDPWHVDDKSLAAGVELVSWFKGETQRIYQTLVKGNGRRATRSASPAQTASMPLFEEAGRRMSEFEHRYTASRMRQVSNLLIAIRECVSGQGERSAKDDTLVERVDALISGVARLRLFGQEAARVDGLGEVVSYFPGHYLEDTPFVDDDCGSDFVATMERASQTR